MDVERIIDEVEQLQEMFEAPDIRPLSASDISAANRRHSPWFQLWQRYGLCCRTESTVLRLPGTGELNFLRMDVEMAKKKTAKLLPKLTEIEQDLLSHIQNGYQLETDSLGGNPILRRLKDNEEIRPLSANRNTIKAMEERGLISPGKGRDPLTIVWRLKRKQP